MSPANVLVVLFGSILIALSGCATTRKVDLTETTNPAMVGTLDHNRLPEASGLGVWRDKLFHINDSGDGPYFYVTTKQGQFTERIAYSDHKPYDTEALAVGKCYFGNCLIVGDTGDNRERRDHITILLFDLDKPIISPVTPEKIIHLKYPDRAHDCEGISLHPNGDLYLATKESDQYKRTASAVQFFKISSVQIRNTKNKGTVVLEHTGEIDLPSLASESIFSGGMVTGFDIHSSGKKFMLLTYRDAFEFYYDIAEEELKRGKEMKEDHDYKIFEFPYLKQQEAIAYSNDNEGILVTTEYCPHLGADKAEIILLKRDQEPGCAR